MKWDKYVYDQEGFRSSSFRNLLFEDKGQVFSNIIAGVYSKKNKTFGIIGDSSNKDIISTKDIFELLDL